MDVLVVGSGGREHALVWKIAQSPLVDTIYCAPGNAGIAEDAQCIDIAADDINALLNFARKKEIGLTVVGPEVALVAGLVDAFEAASLTIFGPSQKAAELEGSKVFAKEFMERHSIPTARFKIFKDIKKAKRYIDKKGVPIVIKADGLAAGKGVIVAQSLSEAKETVEQILGEGRFGAAGDTVVIEECLYGEEASFLAFTDGKTVLPLPTSQDHKAAFDGDTGPNTGGMGAYSPAPIVTEQVADYVMQHVMKPVVEGLSSEGRAYKGILYAGLMINGDDVQVLEFNCRFGDPECQALLVRIKDDIVPACIAACEGRLDEVSLKINPNPAVCVVMASGGYPGACDTGKGISGIKEAEHIHGVTVFHAATERKGTRLVTTGGRVLGVTALGTTVPQAIRKAYKAVAQIKWLGCQYRSDIGAKALAAGGVSAQAVPTENAPPQVGIVMGSDSDFPIMRAAAEILQTMGISCEITVASAHRTPERAAEYAKTAESRGLKAIIAGAGMAAHLAGVLAAHTTLPVIGVPLDASSLGGLDALLSTVQMPPGIPVATMGIGKAGAKNAGVFVCRMLAMQDEHIRHKLLQFHMKMQKEVETKAKKVEKIVKKKM